MNRAGRAVPVSLTARSPRNGPAAGWLADLGVGGCGWFDAPGRLTLARRIRHSDPGARHPSVRRSGSFLRQFQVKADVGERVGLDLRSPRAHVVKTSADAFEDADVLGFLARLEPPQGMAAATPLRATTRRPSSKRGAC
jgi:hypothetical protein